MHLVHIAQDSADTDARFSPRLAILLEESVAFVTNPDDAAAQVDLFKTSLNDLREWCEHAVDQGKRVPLEDVQTVPAPPRMIWAAGVTYKRSQEARMEESSQADVYDRVYDAPRPEIFLKCATVASSNGDPITIRSDSSWDVPEPELTLVINNRKEIVAFAVGNDVSSRSIEGENPLYLPQAKMWNGSASLGSVFRLNTDGFDARNLGINLEIWRGDDIAFEGNTNTNQLHRTFGDLVYWLHRGQDFPLGAYLMTGTGIVPPDDFTLAADDVVTITISQVGQLTNRVAVIDVDTNALRNA